MPHSSHFTKNNIKLKVDIYNNRSINLPKSKRKTTNSKQLLQQILLKCIQKLVFIKLGLFEKVA